MGNAVLKDAKGFSFELRKRLAQIGFYVQEIKFSAEVLSLYFIIDIWLFLNIDRSRLLNNI